DAAARELIVAMAPDDRAALLEEVPAGVARRLVQLLGPAERDATLDLLGYDADTVGRRMTPDFVDLPDWLTAGEALVRIRRVARNRETVYYTYVIDGARRLKGVVSLKDLVMAEPDQKIADIMEPNPIVARTATDQEDAAHTMQEYDLLALPVVDLEGRLVGVLTWDDMADIMEREVTEDVYRYGAVQGLERTYFRLSIPGVALRRVVWLFLLVLVNTVTGTIIAHETDLLEEVAILAAFIPLLIGTGGNVGAQSSTVIIRGLATEDIRPSQAVKVISREVAIGVLLGVILGAIVVLWAWWLGRDLRVGIIVGSTLSIVTAVAALTGGGLPFAFRRFKVDPAMVSAPLVTTVMDIVGVTIYFAVTHLILSL
ncbi:MAG: magnesium transporter, partial [Dehalococcoidia bacterium]